MMTEQTYEKQLRRFIREYVQNSPHELKFNQIDWPSSNSDSAIYLNTSLKENLSAKGDTLLHLAIIHDDDELLNFLLSRGATIDLVDKAGNNIIELAYILNAYKDNNESKIINILNKIIKNNVEYNKIYKSLTSLAKNALEAKNKLEKIFDQLDTTQIKLDLSELLEITDPKIKPSLINSFLYKINDFPLYFAVKRNDLNLTKFLIKNGANYV